MSDDTTTGQPDAPDEPDTAPTVAVTAQEQRDTLTAAIGISWTDFERRHPAQAMAFQRIVRTPVSALMKKLEEGPEYEQLLAQTEQSANLGNLVTAIDPMIISIIGAVI